MASKYNRGVALGEGTWGSVYEAFDKSDNKRVAIKRIKPMGTNLGLNFTALREIKYLTMLKHINIVELVDVFISNEVLHLVLDFCPYDLEKVIHDKTIFLKTPQIKSFCQMMLRGIRHCHEHFIIHRDLKPANLLIGVDGELKLADFGLARVHGSPDNMTSEVVTRWYRAPELLFGATFYSFAVDVWAAACIFAELILRVPFFPGERDIDQLGKIFNVLGTPTQDNWPDAQFLPNFVEYEFRKPLSLGPLFKSEQQAVANSDSSDDLQLLLDMLELDPRRRLSADQALDHSYFTSGLEPTPPLQLPTPASYTRPNDGAKAFKATGAVTSSSTVYDILDIDSTAAQTAKKPKLG